MRPNPLAPASARSSLPSRNGVSQSLLGDGQQRFPKTYRQQLVEVKATMRADLKASGASRDEVADLMSQRLHFEVTRRNIDHWVSDNPHDLKYEIGVVKATAWASIMGLAIIDDNLEEINRCSVAKIDAEIARLYRMREEAALSLAALDIRRTA